MKRISIALTVLISVLIFPINAQAQGSSVYSWTDKDGVKHFSDMAPSPEDAQDGEIQETQTINPREDSEGLDPDNDITVDSLNTEAINDQSGSLAGEPSYADQKREEIQANREASSERNAERDRVCLEARDQLARIEPNRRVFYTNEDGETERMDDVERVDAIKEAKLQIAEYCD